MQSPLFNRESPNLIDPLAEIVMLLQPSALFSKTLIGAGSWHITPPDTRQPFYGVILEGGCRLSVDGHAPIRGQTGDFILIPVAHHLEVTSRDPPAEDEESPFLALGDNQFRVGVQSGPIDLRMLIGHCSFASPDGDLLVSLLPQHVHVHGAWRLAQLVKLVGEESRAQRPAREVVLSRLLEVLFIEALRSTAETATSQGLARGLADPRIARAIRAMHEQPAHAWTMADLATEATLSRSAFFERFKRTVGVAPMAYLLAWRMALAKRMLRQNDSRIAEVAERVGYNSASAFSVAFTRSAGQSPARYARASN
ncbi:MAG TPA: AraC family transcriptional regulator [Oleiagrimonas sp.]|nr:AraC family transcriptional regulator [Oleiagrimonas sp.]